ncbi:phytanoyl-CoA dioxygenase family protein [Nocardia huaxiensis]|uniref:Phytanoyl-CoA dioxygenase family protein n=1 Tax=Nocardia huaxiensis TaxID=2755382 RepID=A0A7D6ZB87_9NOCA|nr:phytanoyl-CoA dioxygenase family protein [Nocardia huaxiensis]QLY31428.1 phytanoyl-CoA dioxygenase family protein [Nocardia huaxiensis]UFS94975.1 phytanoyl-CoA dioxygenase family protein [Nocardia huaxiensis]
MLTDSQVADFITDGFVKLENAFPREVAEAGREILWKATGCDPDDPSTWTQPVHRFGDFSMFPFVAAANTPALREAFDQLVGPGRWWPRNSLGGFVIRFPSDQNPGDDGWHVDASFPSDDPDAEPFDYLRWRVNLTSKGRGLLMLFLFSDVEPDDSPTRIRVGSHLRLAKALEPLGDKGAAVVDEPLVEVYNSTADLPEAYATGRAGDVYLCHPFLVHAGQAHHGKNPRFLAQPPLQTLEPCVLDRPDGAYSPVEQAIRLGLGK